MLTAVILGAMLPQTSFVCGGEAATFSIGLNTFADNVIKLLPTLGIPINPVWPSCTNSLNPLFQC
ncbi:MAG: hypothetical protein AAFY78_22960 [Cyanobacteria bacterium J06648_16]